MISFAISLNKVKTIPKIVVKTLPDPQPFGKCSGTSSTAAPVFQICLVCAGWHGVALTIFFACCLLLWTQGGMCAYISRNIRTRKLARPAWDIGFWAFRVSTRFRSEYVVWQALRSKRAKSTIQTCTREFGQQAVWLSVHCSNNSLSFWRTLCSHVKGTCCGLQNPKPKKKTGNPGPGLPTKFYCHARCRFESGRRRIFKKTPSKTTDLSTRFGQNDQNRNTYQIKKRNGHRSAWDTKNR